MQRDDVSLDLLKPTICLIDYGEHLESPKLLLQVRPHVPDLLIRISQYLPLHLTINWHGGISREHAIVSTHEIVEVRLCHHRLLVLLQLPLVLLSALLVILQVRVQLPLYRVEGCIAFHRCLHILFGEGLIDELRVVDVGTLSC